uniref:Uncharacterized protein n=1 Tax=Plectus sambesii TaxID=2011161 RepID=A0A914XNV5_9BILA
MSRSFPIDNHRTHFCRRSIRPFASTAPSLCKLLSPGRYRLRQREVNCVTRRKTKTADRLDSAPKNSSSRCGQLLASNTTEPAITADNRSPTAVVVICALSSRRKSMWLNAVAVVGRVHEPANCRSLALPVCARRVAYDVHMLSLFAKRS